MESTATKYFDKGFYFDKRQLAHHHPNLGIDLDSMGIDHDLLEEEDEEDEDKGKDKEKEKENNKERGEEKGDTNLFSP